MRQAMRTHTLPLMISAGNEKGLWVVLLTMNWRLARLPDIGTWVSLAEKTAGFMGFTLNRRDNSGGTRLWPRGIQTVRVPSNPPNISDKSARIIPVPELRLKGQKGPTFS